MKTYRTLKLAIRSLCRNGMRAALTMLGIIIGVAAVIAMMEIGNGSATAIRRTMESMGTNNFYLLPGQAASGGINFGAGSTTTLTHEDAMAIGNECPAVEAVAPIIRTSAQVVRGNRNWVPMSLYGTTPSFLECRDWTTMQEGEPFTERDVRNGSKVCVIGRSIANALFEDETPIGHEIRIKNVTFTVIGVLSPKGSNMMGMDQDDIIITPWTTLKYRVSGGDTSKSATATASTSTSTTITNSSDKIYPSGQQALYPAKSAMQQADAPMPIRFSNVSQILVATQDAGDIPTAISQITDLLRERHHLAAAEPDDFNIRNPTEMMNAMTKTSSMITTLLLCTAAISLVVGGVGIMNIMLVSVTERTREIGLRMAVGAEPRDILLQFLSESIVLCLFGGALGILTGRGCSMLVTNWLHWPTAASIGAIVASLAVSASVGIIFGFYPAWKASRLDPIDALRHE